MLLVITFSNKSSLELEDKKKQTNKHRQTLFELYHQNFSYESRRNDKSANKEEFRSTKKSIEWQTINENFRHFKSDLVGD